MNDKPYLFSVIIGTHNRAALLEVALETLCHQSLAPAAYEVIVVDNGSTDETASVVAAFRQRLPNLRYCFEAVPGISVARNHGWRVAQGHYVAFTDDDSRLPAEWLATAQQISQMHAPAAFGGPYFACYEGAKPAWFKDSYGSTKLGDQPRVLTSGYLPGPNLFSGAICLASPAALTRPLGLWANDLAMAKRGRYCKYSVNGCLAH